MSVNTGALVLGGIAVAAIVLVERARRVVEARWYRLAKRRLVDRFGYTSFQAMAEAHAAQVDAADGFSDTAPVWAQWFDVMERDPLAELKRSGVDGYSRLAELDQGSAETLRRAYDAYDDLKRAQAEAFAEFGALDKGAITKQLRATAAALDDARRVAKELPPKTSTLEDAGDAFGSGAAAVGNAFADVASGLAAATGKVFGSFSKAALGGASEQFIVIAGVALVAVILLPRVLP